MDTKKIINKAAVRVIIKGRLLYLSRINRLFISAYFLILWPILFYLIYCFEGAEFALRSFETSSASVERVWLVSCFKATTSLFALSWIVI